ncbi:hypothetical protein CAJAP_11143 [Camponotus japonicus]
MIQCRRLRLRAILGLWLRKKISLKSIISERENQRDIHINFIEVLIQTYLNYSNRSNRALYIPIYFTFFSRVQIKTKQVLIQTYFNYSNRSNRALYISIYFTFFSRVQIKNKAGSDTNISQLFK